MSKNIVQKVRGMRDILPDEQKYFQYLSKTFEESCGQTGFKKVYTPTVEQTALFVRTVGKGTDIISKEMYSFKDKSGKPICLRPEGTAPVARAYLEGGMTSLPQPVKLYYEMPMFRYDRPQAGRYREHWQFGAEVLGGKAPTIDVTVIALALRTIKSVGLSDVSLQINSIGCPSCRPKYRKILTEYLKENEKKLCKDCKKRLKSNPLRAIDCKQPSCIAIADEAPQTINHLCSTCHEHFRTILEYLDEIDIMYDLNHRLVRGLDYYTRTVFEIWTEGEGGQNALGGGGRYDGLTELLGGKSVTGIGFGLGADRIVAEMQKQEVKVPQTRTADIFVAQLGDEAKKKCFKILFNLRNAGISAEGSIDRGSISEQMRTANRIGAQYSLIIGQKEAFDSTVIIKDMYSGSQEIYPSARAVKEIQKKLGKLKK